MSQRVFQLNISLREIEPKIWRRIQVLAETPLADFSAVIQKVMGWRSSHLHEFRVEDLAYSHPDFELDQEAEVYDEQKTRLSGVMASKKTTLIYIYDLGDHWEHEIVLEKALESEDGVKYPRCMSGERAAPPEDCGGSQGYVECLAAYTKPSHPDHAEMKKWVTSFYGDNYNPEHFDVESVNALLRRKK